MRDKECSIVLNNEKGQRGGRKRKNEEVTLALAVTNTFGPEPWFPHAIIKEISRRKATECIAEGDVCIPMSWKRIVQPHGKYCSQRGMALATCLNTAQTDSFAHSVSSLDSVAHLSAFNEPAWLIYFQRHREQHPFLITAICWQHYARAPDRGEKSSRMLNELLQFGFLVPPILHDSLSLTLRMPLFVREEAREWERSSLLVWMWEKTIVCSSIYGNSSNYFEDMKWRWFIFFNIPNKVWIQLYFSQTQQFLDGHKTNTCYSKNPWHLQSININLERSESLVTERR